MRLLDPIREEHALLLPHIDGLLEAADAVDLPGRHAFEFVDEAWRFVTDHLMVHAALEEHVLYSAFTEVVGSTEAVELLTADHRVIGDLLSELRVLRRQSADRDELDVQTKRQLRRVLIGLHVLIRSHFDKEETILLPALEARLAPGDADRLARAMVHKSHVGS